ncbi:MAG: response regulator [Hahellaceae bacterium]|nr:response regulator [Hahellaceae bacterium]
MPRILIIEDEVALAEILRDYLRAEGFEVSLRNTGDQAIAVIRETHWDLVILDRMLPGLDGLQICKEVRQFSQVPILMVTAKVEETDRLQGLEVGADDYICKPFSPREVVARVKTVLRRSAQPSPQSLSAQSNEKLHLDGGQLRLYYGETYTDLTRVEFGLIEALLSRPLRIHSRDALMNRAYDDHRVVSDRTIDSHITKLRKKMTALMGADPIRSIYGVGYRLEEG